MNPNIGQPSMVSIQSQKYQLFLREVGINFVLFMSYNLLLSFGPQLGVTNC